MKNKNDLATLEQFKEKHYGKLGTPKRDELEAGYENFKIGVFHNLTQTKYGNTKNCRRLIDYLKRRVRNYIVYQFD